MRNEWTLLDWYDFAEVCVVENIELKPMPATKPPFRIPTLAEISKIKWNGRKVASTFSGAGGSCLGYRMAGFKVVWANDFIPHAIASYQQNHPGSFIDPRNIRTVKPEEILAKTGLKKGELDLFDGSPPCESFSMAGNREKEWGKVKDYSGTRQKLDDLFFEYIRILNGLQPKVFVAENVAGMVKGTVKGMFIEILQALKACGYRVSCRVLDAQWLGVPQSRARVIFVGVRNDLKPQPAHPSPLPYRYSVRDAMPWIIRSKYNRKWRSTAVPSCAVSKSACDHESSGQGLGIVEALTEETHGQFPDSGNLIGTPCRAIRRGNDYHLKMTERQANGQVVKRKLHISEVKVLCTFPEDFIMAGSRRDQWERLGNSVPPVMMWHIASTIRDRVFPEIP